MCFYVFIYVSVFPLKMILFHHKTNLALKLLDYRHACHFLVNLQTHDVFREMNSAFLKRYWTLNWNVIFVPQKDLYLNIGQERWKLPDARQCCYGFSPYSWHSQQVLFELKKQKENSSSRIFFSFKTFRFLILSEQPLQPKSN